jgi:dolichol-phosphate mannosyltransferase
MLIADHDGLIPVPGGPLKVANMLPTASFSHQPQAGPTPFPRFSLIIPTYNEARNLQKIVQLVSHILDQVIPDNYELIVVDDNSPDRTWELAQALTVEYPCLRVMRRQQERGLSTAVIRGWQAARGEILGVIDGDLQHPPDVLLQMLAAVDQGADLAVASRHVEGGGVSRWSLTRRILSRGAQLLGLVLCPRVVGRVSDPMSGYFLVRRSAIAEQLLSPVGYKILLEVIGRGKISQIAEVGYVFRERQEGESKVTWKQYQEYLHHLLRLRLSSGRIGRLRQRFDFPIQRFLQFGLVGLSGLIVDMSILYALHEWIGLGITRSAILAAEVAILNNFFWNDRWTFVDIARGQGEWRKVLKRLTKFNIVCLMGLILKVLLLNLLFNVFHLNVYLANVIAIAAVTLWNFWINLKLSWRVTDVR